jgi:hypothetical protein
MENSEPDPAVSGAVVTTPHVLRLAGAAYLARFSGQSRIHTESDLRGYLGRQGRPRPAATGGGSGHRTFRR